MYYNSSVCMTATHSTISPLSGNNVLIIVIGTKLDLVNANENLREINEESGMSIATTHSNIIAFHEVSAKDGTNIDTAFHTLSKAMKDRVESAEMCECDISQAFGKNVDTVSIDRRARQDCSC